MSDNNDLNLVGMLREKSEEADLKQYLKSTMGGYTKKSVLEYVAVLRKKQQTTAETFNRNMQTLFEEKENLKSDNDKLLLKIKQIESEYQILTETLKIHDLENTEFSLSDIITLKSTISALEAENKKHLSVNRELDRKIERLGGTIQEKDTDLEKAVQETKIQKELLANEKIETKNQRELVSQLSGTIKDLQEEISYLKELLAEGKVAKLNSQVSELMANISLQEDIISHKARELETKENIIQTLSEDNDSIKQSMEHLSRSIENLMIQNEKLMSSYKALAQSLESEQKKSIELINEKSEETVEKLLLNRKLTELNQKMSVMEMGSRKTSKSQTTNHSSTDKSTK